MLDTLVNAFLLTAVGGLLALQTRGLRAEIRQEIASLRAEFREELARHAGENREDFALIRAEIGALRSDVTRIALALGARPEAAEG